MESPPHVLKPTWLGRLAGHWRLWLLLASSLLWSVVFVPLFLVPEMEAVGEITSEQLGDLKIFGPDREQHAVLKREEAIKIGLEHTDTTIHYTLLAAAALLGLVGKMLIDPLVGAGARMWAGTTLILFSHSAFGALLSIFFGYVAHAFMSELPTNRTFTIYEEMGAAANCQIFAFVLSGLLLMIALMHMAYGRLKENERGGARDEK